MKKLYLMIGIPGSGKSTFIKYFNPKGATFSVVSRDDIRFNMVAEDEPYFSKEKDVFREFVAQISTSLEHNDITFADATHINEGSRGKLFRALGKVLKDVEIIAVVLKVPLEVALERNSHRIGRKFVPETVIKNMYSQLTIPTFAEGFNKIEVYHFNKEGRIAAIQEEIK